jgi:hypothetical protein
MTFTVQTFGSWDEFKNGVRAKLPGANDYDVYKRFIFRGQGSADWPLKSTFDRVYSDQQAASRDIIAKELIKEFYERNSTRSASAIQRGGMAKAIHAFLRWRSIMDCKRDCWIGHSVPTWLPILLFRGSCSKSPAIRKATSRSGR